MSEALPIIGPIVGGIFGSQGAQSAADTQAQAANFSALNNLAMFNQQQANLAPWRATGQQANAALANWMGLSPGGVADPNAPGMRQFNASMLPGDPSYQWQLGEGQRAILNNMSAMGGTFSGNTARALEQYTQGLASTDYQNALANFTNWQNNVFNRLNTISGTGANVAGGIANLGQGAAQTAGNNLLLGGASQAGGRLGSTNALLGGFEGALNAIISQNALGNVPSFGLGANQFVDPFQVQGP